MTYNNAPVEGKPALTGSQTGAVERAIKQQAVKRITAAWQKSVSGIIECGRLLNEAKAEFPPGEFTVMVDEDLPFSARTSEYLMAIARDQRLVNPHHGSLLLPANWRTMAELTTLSDDEFARGIETGAINPDMTGRAVAALKTKPEIEPPPAKPAPSKSRREDPREAQDRAATEEARCQHDEAAQNAARTIVENMRPSARTFLLSALNEFGLDLIEHLRNALNRTATPTESPSIDVEAPATDYPELPESLRRGTA